MHGRYAKSTCTGAAVMGFSCGRYRQKQRWPGGAKLHAGITIRLLFLSNSGTSRTTRRPPGRSALQAGPLCFNQPAPSA